MKKYIRIGSRDSKLAIIQAEIVKKIIMDTREDVEVSIITMKTSGDMILDRTLDEIGGKGLFVKELDIALREKRVDLTVHSLKDMPMEIPEDLPVLAYTKREDPRDALILKHSIRVSESEPEFEIKEIPQMRKIGSSAKRRKIQLETLFPDSESIPIRGNIQTRFQKLEEQEYDAIVLAVAGLKRLNLMDKIYRIFEPEEILPAAGQGILAVQGRENEGWEEYLKAVNNKESEVTALAERAFVHTLDGGCSSPVAAYAQIQRENMQITGLYYHETSGKYYKETNQGKIENAKQLGIELAERMKRRYENE